MIVITIKESRALVRRWYKAYSEGKGQAMAIIDELCSDNYVYHGSSGGERHGLKNFKQDQSEFFNAFPDIQFTINDMVTEGDKIATRFTMVGTHKGEFAGIPPTNKKATVWGIGIDRVDNGKFVESWVRFDTLGYMQQLGLIPKTRKT